MTQFERLYDIIKTLRSENGCPWDREQTLHSMKDSMIEETYEVLEAIDNESSEDLREELGDLMFLCIFLGYIAEQDNEFTIDDSLKDAGDKLIRRHPHVFSDRDVDGVDDVIRNWEEIKLTEKKNHKRKTPFDGIPKHLPELQKYYKVLNKLKQNDVDIKSITHEPLNACAQSLESDFTEESVQKMVKSLMIESYIHNIDISAVFRNATQNHINDYLSTNKEKNI